MAIIIRNTKEDKPGYLRLAVYGDLGVGKTTFAATFPRPFFLSVGAEQGISSLTQLPYPVDYALITSQRDMIEALDYVKANYEKKKWATVVVDTASVYGRFVSMEESRHGIVNMDQQKWMKVLGHLLNIRDVLHNLPLHVVWVFHAEDEKNGEVVLKRRAKLVGQARVEILQTCSIVGYLERYQTEEEKDEKGTVVKPSETIRQFWVRCPPNASPPFEYKCWYEQVLVKPKYIPHFMVLAKYLAPHHITPLCEVVPYDTVPVVPTKPTNGAGVIQPPVGEGDKLAAAGAE